jgi:peroxiredoxin
VKRLLRPLPLAVLAGLVALVALLAYGVGSTGAERGIDDALARGERTPAPVFSLPTLDGRGSRTLDSYRGQVVVLNYWASWCAPCRAESPLLERWHRRLGRRGGTVLGVDTDDVRSDAQAFVRRYGLTYPMLRDAEGATKEEFGVVALPETLVLDRAGRVAAVIRGAATDEDLRRAVEPLLAERA